MKRLIKRSLTMTMVLMVLLTSNLSVLANGEGGSILSTSYGSTYIIRNDHSLWGWGQGYTGNGDDEEVITPIKVLTNVRSVSSNSGATVAVKNDDTLWGWGFFDGTSNGQQRATYGSPVQLMENVLMAAKGDDYLLVVKNDYTLWLSGKMYLGDGSLEQATDGFVQVMSGVKYCAAGEDTIFVVKEDDTLWGWGDNTDALLGNMIDGGDLNNGIALTAVKILDDVKLVSNSSDVVCAIRLDGSLYSWGGGSDGIYTESGWIKNAGSPYKVMDHVVSVGMTDNAGGILVVKEDETLWGWGTSWNREREPKEPIKYADNVRMVACGERHAAVVKTDNTLWTMGGNYRGGLGYDSDETWYTPLTQVLDQVMDAPVDWAREEVEAAIGKQLIPEYLQNNYDQSITREEFCVLAVRLIETKSAMTIEDYLGERGMTMASSSTFTDTSNSDILAAKTLGITDGTSPTTFSPDNQLTREQAAKFLSATARAVGKDITATTPSYSDVDEIADWAKPYTGYVYNINVMKGVGGNRFSPRGGYQRQQAFMTMNRLFDAIDSVTMDKLVEETAGSSLDGIKADLLARTKPTSFFASLEGSAVDQEQDAAFNLTYDIYYKEGDIHVDTYMYDRIAYNQFYLKDEDATYVHYDNYEAYGEYAEGYSLPFRLLDPDLLQELKEAAVGGDFTATYVSLDQEEALYIESRSSDGVSMEVWYSLAYLIPIKMHKTWMVGDEMSETKWSLSLVDPLAEPANELFIIPASVEIVPDIMDAYWDQRFSEN